MIPQFHVDTGNLRFELESLPRKLQRKVVKRVMRAPLKQGVAYAKTIYAGHRSKLFREHMVDHFFVKTKAYRTGLIWGAVGVRIGHTPKHIPTGKGWQKAQFLPGWRFHLLERPVKRRNGSRSPGANKWPGVVRFVEGKLKQMVPKALDEALVALRRAR